MSEREDVFEFCDSCGVEVPVDYYRCDECVEAGGPVIEQCTYNPATHRLVPRDAVVLEAEHVDTLVDLAAQAIQPWWKDEPRLDYRERYREGRDAIEHAESAFASAQGNEEGNDGDPDTGEGG